MDVAAEHVPDARLVLFNRQLARQLNLELPDSDDDLEAWVIEKFAWFNYGEAQSSTRHHKPKTRTFFATRYQDSDDKSVGSALGDGRAVWVEEIVIEQANGGFQYHDVVLKGTGITPLAWLNHAKKSHRDGQAGLTEVVHEYIYSLIAIENGIDSVAALAVIELPFIREAENEKAAIIVRVGNHLRFAHYQYFSEDSAQLEKIFEYGLKRDLGLALDHLVSNQDVRNYLNFIGNNSAKDAAAYYDLHAVHGAPTYGNRTSNGGTIDLSTFVYLDAHHGKYSYMPGNANSLSGDWGQTQQIFNLFSGLLKFVKNSQFKFVPEIEPVEYFLGKFNDTFEQILTRRWLNRLGLSDREIRILSELTKERFYEIVKSIYEAEGLKPIKLKQGKTVMAAFEPRKILSQTIENFENFADLFLIWKNLFKVDRHWASIRFLEAKPYIVEYLKSVTAIITELNASTETLAVWKKRSAEIKLSLRNEPGADFFYDAERFVASAEVLRQIQAGSHWHIISETAAASALKLVDIGLVSAR